MDPSADRIPRWAWAVVAGVGALVLWLVAPEAIRATFSSPETFLRVAAVIVALMLFGRLVGHFVPNRTLATVIRILPVVAVSWWALSPYVSPSEVDEAFPVFTVEATDTTTTTDAPPTSTATTATSTPTDTTTADPTATDPTDTTDLAAAAPVAAADTTTTSPPTTITTTTTTTSAAPPEPVQLRSGSFQGLAGHRGSGTAAIYDLPDGSRLLRFEDLDAGPGPDMDVYLVPRADARSLRDAIRVADLTAERGNQNYTVPDAVDPTSGDWTVLIWCQSFAVEVANATLR